MFSEFCSISALSCSVEFLWCSQWLFFLNLLGLRLLLGCDNMSVKQTHKWKMFLAWNLKTNRKIVTPDSISVYTFFCQLLGVYTHIGSVLDSIFSANFIKHQLNFIFYFITSLINGSFWPFLPFKFKSWDPVESL